MTADHQTKADPLALTSDEQAEMERITREMHAAIRRELVIRAGLERAARRRCLGKRRAAYG